MTGKDANTRRIHTQGVSLGCMGKCPVGRLGGLDRKFRSRSLAGVLLTLTPT